LLGEFAMMSETADREPAPRRATPADASAGRAYAEEVTVDVVDPRVVVAAGEREVLGRAEN